MTPIIILAAIIGLTIINALVLRVHATFLFLSILLGDLLVRFLSDDVAFAIGAFVPSQNVPLVSQALVLVTPIILTLMILRRSVSKSKLPLHLLPIIGCSLLLVVLLIPILPSPIQADIFATPQGDFIRKSQDVITGITAIIVLLVTWQSFYHRPDKHKKHSKHL